MRERQRLINLQLLPDNAQEQQRKELDVKTGQPIQMGDVIYTNNLLIRKLRIKMNLLFAIDLETEEIIVSESPKGSNKINFIERISKNENEILFSAVQTLTIITKSSNFDISIFKAMDKVCQITYNKHKEKS